MNGPSTPKITAADIEIALSHYFHCRRNFVIPNVSWGFRGLSYEIDVMVVTQSLYAYDIEIKVSASDLKRDQKKYKWNYCESQHYFKHSYFAIPAALAESHSDSVPAHCGILAVSYNSKSFNYDVTETRAAAADAHAKKVTESELAQLGRLTMLRMWDLKQSLRTTRRQYHDLREKLT